MTKFESSLEAVEALDERIEAIMAQQVIPSSCEWPEARRAMLRIMAAAYATGDQRVTVGKAVGTLLWTPKAIRLGRPKSNNLADDEKTAADEIAEVFDNQSFRLDIARRVLAENAARLVALKGFAQAVWGDEWISPLSREIDVALRSVQRWAAVEIPVPRWLIDRLPAMAQKHLPTADVLEKRAALIRKTAQGEYYASQTVQ